MDFNSEAMNWDTEKRVTRAKKITDEIIASMKIKENECALEFGCGTGLLSFNLQSKFKHITLVDTSKGMIEILNQKIQNANIKNMTAIETDINSHSILNSKFDTIYTSMALHHINEIEITLKNLCSLLNSEGHLCIVELVEDDGSFHMAEKDFDGHNGFNQNNLKKLLEKLGLVSVKTKVFYNDSKTINGTKVDYSLFIMIASK